MNYTGKIIVTNKEGIRQQHQWGTVNKLLCEETTGNANFTFGELHYTPGEVRGPFDGHEACHCLKGTGILKAWPDHTPKDQPFTVSLRLGTEYYVRGDVPRTVENTGAEPLFGIAFMCHIDRSCHAHEFSHQPGTGNTLHYHGIDKWVEPLRQEFVEAMYLIEGPGNIASADPDNIKVEDYEIEEGSAVYHPLNTLHRQYHPGGVDHANFWIHAGYYYGPRDDQPPEYSTCPTSPPGSENAK
jgi:oxalate decarboxylase/phosphoglucose isomerase-like protein (cupin superfamily)